MESAHRMATLLLALAAGVSPGCKASRESANLAKAGTTYAAAMDSLLVAAATIEIDTTSEGSSRTMPCRIRRSANTRISRAKTKSSSR